MYKQDYPDSRQLQQIHLCSIALLTGQLFCLGAVFVAAGSLVFACPDRPVAAIEDRINPNVAETASLLLLPGIGPARAAAIIEYRSSCGKAVAFRCAADMRNVRGIGLKTIGQMEDRLVFDDSNVPEGKDPVSDVGLGD